MLAKTYSATMLGLQPLTVEVEIDANRGVPGLSIIGLPSKTVEEAKQRVTSALQNAGVRIKSLRTVVNLAPADVRKDSSHLELAIAVALLKLYGIIKKEYASSLLIGELSLDGSVRRINGALPLVLAAHSLGFSEVIVPADNLPELSFRSDTCVLGVKHLRDLISSPSKLVPPPATTSPAFSEQSETALSLGNQELAQKALILSAAGGHNLLLIGPPGAGKSYLAQLLPHLLPKLSETENLEVSSIYSVRGLLKAGLLSQRPFRAPHHTSKLIGILGGGSKLKPGEISLAHRGTLFLDEFPEFNRTILESLRQPLELGRYTLATASGTVSFPAAFTLVAAANPCPCGYAGSTKKICHCTSYQKSNYLKRISGPMMDRIDLQVRVPELSLPELQTATPATAISTTLLREKIQAVQNKQHQRYQKLGPNLTNAKLTLTQTRELCTLDPPAQRLLTKAADKLTLSLRSYYKIIKVAQTIADVEEASKIYDAHIAQALHMRLEREHVT